MFLTRTLLGKTLGIAILGGAAMLAPSTAKADGFRLRITHGPIVFAPPVYIQPQPVYATPVYQAPACPAPVYQAPVVVPQPVYVDPAVVCTPPVVIYDRDGRHERHAWFDRHDDHRDDHRDFHQDGRFGFRR